MTSMATAAKARVVQITVWFGLNRRMRVRADSDVSKDPTNSEVAFRRSGAGDDDDDETKVVLQILKKCLDAYLAGKHIDIRVENGEITPDP